MPWNGLFVGFQNFIKKKKRLSSWLHGEERWQATLHFLTGDKNSQKPPYALQPNYTSIRKAIFLVCCELSGLNADSCIILI